MARKRKTGRKAQHGRRRSMADSRAVSFLRKLAGELEGRAAKAKGQERARLASAAAKYRRDILSYN